jgi:lipoate-protein ligase A
VGGTVALVTEPLRVIDFGTTSPLRSQTLWHAVAYGVSAGAPATLSFARPARPYVCLGYHRRPDEVDRRYCRANSLPVLRRMVGGGPVYLDADQLFFQICLPVGAVPPARWQALRMLLEPAVSAFRAAGVPAELDQDLEICVGDAKVCGHGGGQVDQAVVVCGNLIERFDHARAARVLALAGPAQRAQTLALMRRFVVATPVSPAAFQGAMTGAYAQALGLDAVTGELSGTERAALGELDARFSSSTWLAGPYRPAPQSAGRTPAHRAKVRAGVWTFAAEHEGARVAAGIVRGRIDQVHVRAAGLNGSARQAELALVGAPLCSVTDVLAGFGEPGRRLAEAFAACTPGEP